MAAVVKAKTPAELEAEGKALLARYNAPTVPTAFSTDLSNRVDQFKTTNWQNGTATGLTPEQNLSNTVSINQADLMNRQADQRAANSGVQGGGTPNPTPTTPTYTPPPGNVDTTPIKQAMQSYVPPAATGMTYDQATSQVKGQIDPMFARALEDLQKQKYQDQLNGDQLGMARGGSHSGLAADLQNKVGIAAAGKASDLDATRQTQIAQMAQDLVNRGQDNDFRNKQQALAEYLGINGLNLQAQGQAADYSGMFQGTQTMQAKNADRSYGLELTQQQQNEANTKFAQQQQIDATAYQKARDSIADKNYQKEFENNIKQQGFENAMKTALQAHQISNDNYQLAISKQNANTSAASQANSANNSNVNQLMDVWKATGKAPAGIPNVAAGTPYGGQTAAENKLSTAEGYASYTDGVAKYATNQKTGTQELSNPIDVEASILQSNLSEAEMKKLYTRYGLKWGG